MGSRSRIGLARLALVAAIAAVAVALLAAGGHAALASVAKNSATFPDSTGEDPAAPDITSVTVSNDDAGVLTFQINVPNRPTLTGDMLALIYVDSDDKTSSGAFGVGIDYVIQLAGPLDGPAQVGLFRWDGTDFTSAGVSQTSLIFGYANGVATIRLKAAELGGTKRFKFAAEVDSGYAVGPGGELDDTNVHFDLAPDPGRGFFTYDVKTALLIRSFGSQPASPTAGKPYTRIATVRRSDGAAVGSGTVACRASISGRALRVASKSFANGRATCTFRIPAGARGKTIRGTVTITSGGVRVARSFSARIR